MQYDEKDLFDRLVELKTKALEVSNDIKAIKKDYTFHKTENTEGLPKGDIKLIDKVASLYAKDNFLESKVESLAVIDLYESLVDDE